LATVWSEEASSRARQALAPYGRGVEGVDLYNLFNTNYATSYNTTYSYTLDAAPRPAGWGTPTGLASPRFVRLNFTMNF
jgi:hypothetical protein